MNRHQAEYTANIQRQTDITTTAA